MYSIHTLYVVLFLPPAWCPVLVAPVLKSPNTTHQPNATTTSTSTPTHTPVDLTTLLHPIYVLFACCCALFGFVHSCLSFFVRTKSRNGQRSMERTTNTKEKTQKGKTRNTSKTEKEITNPKPHTHFHKQRAIPSSYTCLHPQVSPRLALHRLLDAPICGRTHAAAAGTEQQHQRVDETNIDNTLTTPYKTNTTDRCLPLFFSFRRVRIRIPSQHRCLLTRSTDGPDGSC